MTTSAVKNNNLLPPGLVSNLQEVLLSRKGGGEDEQSKNANNDADDDDDESTKPPSSTEPNLDEDNSKPLVLVTNADGIDSPGLTYLVQALVREALYNVHVCAPQSDKSVSGHSVTLRETVTVSSAEINGATAYEVSGTPVDCVSLALCGALFSWSKPLLVISGINRGSSCGHHMFYSGVVAGAREALMSGVPSMSISLNWKKDESQDTDFKDAVTVCLPLIKAAIRDIEKGIFPRSCLLNIEVPTSPLTNKGFKFTKQSLWRSTPNWQAISANRATGRFMSNQQSLGMQLAQLSRDASAAGAARRLTTQRKNLEVVESVGVAGKSDSNRSVKYFRLEFLDKEQEDVDEDLDFRALENGFVAITSHSVSPHIELNTQTAASEWISVALHVEQ
ncbi:5'-nucleotidase SurE [Camellia lanceoleosa]|uniref:5'-nucleotidase SurE n=1 Tax=Camellia lanceoleosa TaxID=1840588 RepID=A0ACC0HXV8_9ERIC|nr:5'-nucleotidase SurE [Camellia lanceoleosa]